MEEWQVKQAETAIRVYLKNYLDADESIFSPDKKEESYAGDEDSYTAAMDVQGQLQRMKNLSLDLPMRIQLGDMIGS